MNGLHIYGTRDFDEGEEGRAVHTLGVLESNERLLEGLHPLASPLRFIGDVDDQMLAYDTADGRWKLMDRAGWDPTVTRTPMTPSRILPVTCCAAHLRFEDAATITPGIVTGMQRR